jgi:O-antigen/teichoic acid export membrane protein
VDQGRRSKTVGAATAQSSILRHPATAPAEDADCGMDRPGRYRLPRKVLRIAGGPHVLALVDQAIVSCTSFLTTVLIARWTFPSELGSFSIAISLLFPLFCVQEALISLPYTIQRHRSLGTPAQYAGSSLAHNVQLSVLAVAALALGALGLSAANAPPNLVASILILAALAPFALLREFGRRFAFAHLQMGQAVMIDLAGAAMQTAGLVWLGWTDNVSAVSACTVLGVAHATVGIAWLYCARARFSIRGFHVQRSMRQSWTLGKWLGASQLTTFVRTYSAHWLLAWVDGTAATGVYAACMSIVAFANPLILGFSNVLAPKAALALSERGRAGLIRETLRDAVLIAAVMSLFCAAIAFTGGDVIRLLYHDPAYDGQENTLTVLALAALAHALGMPASNALASLERPRAIFWTALLAVVLSLVLTWVLVGQFGLIGAAYGVLGGNLVALVGRWIVFLVLAPRATPTGSAGTPPDSVAADVIQALQRLTHGRKVDRWVVEPLGEGYQAHVCMVRSQDEEPIWQQHRALVVKLYKPGTNPSLHLAREQFESLWRLRAAMNDRPIEGWKVSAPAPVYLCTSPLALVMTHVSGRNLEWCLQVGNDVTPDTLRSAPRAIAAALQDYWSFGRPYGELSLGNMLGDITAKEISFVDSGVRHDSHFCEDVSKRWYPASRDLAYLLYDLGVGIEIGQHGARIRKEIFTDGILRAALETVESAEDRLQFLAEIEACARAHLRTLEPSWSLPGLWHILVRHLAARRIDRLIAGLRVEIAHSPGGPTPRPTRLVAGQR